MKILFVWRKYDRVVGGVERMSIALMNEMVRRGHDVALLSWDRAGAKTYYALDPRVDWHQLDAGNPDEKAGWGLRIKRSLAIRKIVKQIQPDVAIAFMDGVFLSVKLAVLGLHIPVVEAERCSAARFEYLSSGKYSKMIFQSLRLARNITVQLESYREDYPEYLRGRIVSIPNPVFPANGIANPASGNEKILLSVGRLSYQKNYSVLVKAFASLAAEFPQWQLRIVGDGEEKEQLQKLISSLGMGGRIGLVGTTDNVGDFYRGSHLFCLPSRWEGFPNALAEALAHGLPAVGFAECLGVCDLIEDGRNGLLAPGMDDPAALAGALRALMNDDAKRAEMGAEATRSMESYGPEAIFDKWEQFFLKAAV